MFAGQTGTGKTHTMQGDMSGGGITESAGIIPRTVVTLFSSLRERAAEFSMRVTHIELYNEEITDLLGGVLTCWAKYCSPPPQSTQNK
jgi:kinesin family protein 11